MVDMWPKRVEAFPSSKQTAAMAATDLITAIIPSWGMSKISRNNGAKQHSNYLQFDLRQYCAYHRASGGAVEQDNRILKQKLIWELLCHGLNCNVFCLLVLFWRRRSWHGLLQRVGPCYLYGQCDAQNQSTQWTCLFVWPYNVHFSAYPFTFPHDLINDTFH